MISLLDISLVNERKIGIVPKGLMIEKIARSTLKINSIVDLEKISRPLEEAALKKIELMKLTGLS